MKNMVKNENVLMKKVSDFREHPQKNILHDPRLRHSTNIDSQSQGNHGREWGG